MTVKKNSFANAVNIQMRAIVQVRLGDKLRYNPANWQDSPNQEFMQFVERHDGQECRVVVIGSSMSDFGVIFIGYDNGLNGKKKKRSSKTHWVSAYETVVLQTRLPGSIPKRIDM